MDDVAAMIKSIEKMISQISDKVKGNPHIQALNKVLKGPLGYLKKLLLMMVLSLFAATLGPIVDNAKDKVEKVKKLKKIIEKIIKLIKQIVKVVKAIFKAVVKIIKPILQLYFTFPSPACWVAWAVTIITAIIVFLGILLGRFGTFAGEFVMDFDKMQEMNQVEEDYTDLLNTGALKEAFYESIADTSFYQTFNLSDMEGSNISWADRLVAGVASLVTGQEYTSEDILAQQKCVAGQTSCIYSSGGLMDMFTWAGISVPHLDPRYQITDASKNPAKYLIQAEGLGTYSDALGITSYFRDYWNREEQFSLDKDFLYELNRWLYETDAYPTTEQIVYPEAFVQPVSFVDDFLRIQSDKTVDGFGDPYVYVTQRVTLEDIQDLDSEYYNKYEYEGLIKTTPSDIVYDYVVKGTNSYEIIQQSASANQVNIGNPSDYATVKKVITYEDGSTEVTYVAMKAYWIVNPIFKDRHMGLDVTFEDYTSYIDPNDDRIGDPTGYYYRETPGGALKSIDITTEAYIGPFLDMSVEGNDIVFNTKVNLKKTDAGKIINNDYTKLREYIYQQYNPNIANSAFVTFEDGTYAFVNCVIDYSKSTKLVDKNGNELTKQKIYGKEAIFYEGAYYYFNADASSSMEIDSLSIGSLKKATGLVVFPRVIDYNQYKNTTIYPGEIVVYSSSKKAYQYNGTNSTTLTTSLSNSSRVRSFNTYNLLPTRHYQLAQLADESGHIVASSRNLINKTYLKTKTVRPYFRNSDEYWLRFEEFVLEDMDRAGYVGVFTDALGIEMQGQCIVKKDEDENFYNLHYCEEADEDKCVAEPEEWDQKKCSVVRYVNQMYPGQDVVAKLSNLFMGDEAEFAELPMSAQSIYTILTLYEDYLIATGTEGVEWEYKYYSNSKMEAAQAAAEMAPSFSFFGIRIPDPWGLTTYFESDKRKYEDTFDKVVELNESRAISSEYTPIGVVSGTTPVVKKVNCPYCGRDLGYLSTSTASCWWCGSVPTGIEDNESNVWGWKIDKEVGGTVYIKKVYGESSLEFPDYYDDADTLAQGISNRFDEILNYFGTFDHRMKLASFLFTSDYAENRYGAVNFAYKWVDNGTGGYKLTYDEAALKDFYTCLFLNSTNLPDRVGEDNDTEDNKYQDIRNDEQAWRDDVTVWRPLETDEMEGIMVSGTVDGRGIGRVTTQNDPDDYLALELKSVRDYGLASVLSYLESRKVTFFTGIALTETYQVDGVYAWMYSYYKNNDTFEYLNHDVTDAGTLNLSTSEDEMVEHQAKMASSGFYPSSLLRDDITTTLIICPHCSKPLSNKVCMNAKCTQYGNRFNKAYKLNDFVRSTEIVQEGGSVFNQDTTIEGLSVGEIFLPSDLANIADGLNELQGTGESIFKYKNPSDNTWYWFTVTYAIGVNDTNTEWNKEGPADEISDLFLESQGYIVMMKKCNDENKDGKITEAESRKTQWIKTNINVAIPYISEYGLQNLFVDKIIERYAKPLTEELIKYYSNADARKEANNQFFNPKGHYLAWYDYSTGNLDLGDMVGSLISQKHLISEYDNNTATQLRRLFNVYESCDDCYCSNANTQIECECGIDVYVDEFKNGAAADDEHKNEADGICDICGTNLDLMPSGKGQLHYNEKPGVDGDGSFGHTVKDLNGDLICDVCNQNACPCMCHSVYVSFENISDIKTSFWSSNNFLEWISETFNIGNLFKDAGKYISSTAYQKVYDTYFEQVNAIDLLDDTRTSKVFMIEEAVTFLGNFLYSYDTKMIIAGDVYGDEKIVSDLVFADRGYVISNYIFAVPAHTTYVQWTSQEAETNYITNYPEGSNDGRYNTDEDLTEDMILKTIYANNPCVRQDETTFLESVGNALESIWKGVNSFIGGTLKLYNPESPTEVIEDGNGFNTKYCASNYYYSEHMVYDVQQTYIYKSSGPITYSNLNRCSTGIVGTVDYSNGGTKAGTKYECSIQSATHYFRQTIQTYKLNEETGKVYLAKTETRNTTSPISYDSSNNGTKAGVLYTYTYLGAEYTYQEVRTTYSSKTEKYSGTKEGGIATIGQTEGWHNNKYYYKASDPIYNKSASYLAYTWEWKLGATYKINKVTTVQGGVHEKYSKLVYIDTYNEITQIYMKLKSGSLQSVPIDPGDKNTAYTQNPGVTANKIFIGMKVMDDYNKATIFKNVPENVKDFIEDATHWYTVRNAYKICKAEIVDGNGYHYICNTVNEISAEQCKNKNCKQKNNFTDVAGAFKLCPICGDLNAHKGVNDAKDKKCVDCGANIKKIEIKYTQNRSQLNYDEHMYDEWCFGRTQGTKCRSLAWGDSEDHYTVYSSELLTTHSKYLSDTLANALMVAGGMFTDKWDIEDNLEHRTGLLLGNNRLTSSGKIATNTWWLESNLSHINTTSDGYKHTQYDLIVDSNGNLDDDAITYAMTSNDWATIKDEMFELDANDLANIMQAITEVYGENYDAEGFVELGGNAFETTDGRAVVLSKSVAHNHINKSGKSDYYYEGEGKAHVTYWNSKARGTSIVGESKPTILIGDKIEDEDLNDGETKSGSCSVNFYWMPYEYNYKGATNGGYADDMANPESYLCGTSVYKRHYLTTDWKALLVGVEAGDKASYGTPIALETTLYGNYKQITPVQTSMFFNEEVYKNWRERMNPDSGDVNSVIKEQYLLSYRNATSTYLYDYLTNFETYLPLSVKSDADLVNRGADAYRSIQANDQRALAFTGSFIGNIKKNLGTTGWVTIIENYNQKSPSLSSIISSLIPATVSNDLDADILAEYIAGLIETTVEYAPEWTIEYYNYQISQENKDIAASNEGKAEADKAPLKPLIERSYDNYAAIEDTLYYSLFATSTKMDPDNMKEYRTVTLYLEDGTTADYDMLYLGAGAILSREYKSISTTEIANEINGFGNQSLTIGTQSGKDIDERLDMEKSLKYITIKFGKLLYKYGNVSSATMAYFYGEDYWDEMLMVAKTNGISTGPEWHNDDAELIDEVLARKLGNANQNHSLFPVLDYDEEVIENVYTAQVVDYALSFVQDSQDRLFLIRNTSTSLGKAVQSIGSNAEKTKQFLELLQDGDLDVFIGHKYAETELFTIDYSDIQELARKFNVDLGVVMAVMMGESDGDPCYGLGTCRIQDEDYIVTQLIGTSVTERRVGLFGIPYIINNNSYSTDYTVSKVDYKQACLATPYNNLTQDTDSFVYGADRDYADRSFKYGITSTYKAITNISMNANGEFVVKYDDFTSSNLGRIEVKAGFYKNYDSAKQGWVDNDGNLLYTVTDSKLDQNGNLVLTYTYANPGADGVYAVVEENLGSVHLISQANNKCTVKTYTSFKTLPTTEAIKSYLYDPYSTFTVVNVENIAQTAEVKPDSYSADQFETIIEDATKFINNDGRFAYEGRIALFYVLSELADIYEQQEEDALATIFVYYYGEEEFNKIKAAAISKGYGNNWYTYYCTTVDDTYNKVMKALSYYDATLEEENTFDIKDTLSEYVNGDKSEKTESSKYYDKAYGRYVVESKKYVKCESTATGKCTKTYNKTDSFITTNAAGGKCDTATATAKFAGRDNLVINSVTQVSKTSTYDRSYSFAYKDISLSTCQSAYDSYVNKIAASGATSNTLKSKDEVCKASGLKNKNTYSVTIDFSDMYTREWVWDNAFSGHYEDNESELSSMCAMEADPELRNMTVGELLGDMSEEAIYNGMMNYLQRKAEAENRYWNSTDKKCTVSYTVTQDRDSIGLSGIWFYTYSENNQINADEADIIGKEAWLAKYKDYSLFRQTGNEWFNSDKISVSAPSTETILPSVTFSFTTQNETSSSMITAYSTGLSSQSRTTTNENSTYNCSVNYTYTQTSDVSDKESCKVSGANVIDAVFTFDDPNYSQGKYKCDVERTRTIDYANNWNLTINGFSVMAFSLFDDMSSYNEVTADKLAKQNSGIEVYIKEGGNTRTDVDSIITATLATEDNFLITSDSYSLFAFFEQVDDYLDDSARSWFSPIGLDEDRVGPGTTNNYVKSKIWDFPVLMRWTNTPVGIDDITIVEQFGEENNILAGGVKHNDGITIKAKRGTAIRPVFGGTITAAGYNNIYGNYVEVQSNSLSALNPMIISTTEGERYQITGVKAIYGYLAGEERGGIVWNTQYSNPSVTTSTTLGYAGLTGQTTGEQLYFALYVQCNVLDENDEVVETIGWTAVDPEPYFTTFFNVDYQ